MGFWRKGRQLCPYRGILAWELGTWVRFTGWKTSMRLTMDANGGGVLIYIYHQYIYIYIYRGHSSCSTPSVTVETSIVHRHPLFDMTRVTSIPLSAETLNPNSNICKLCRVPGLAMVEILVSSCDSEMRSYYIDSTRGRKSDG
jgi:hypothetical protein